MTWWDRGNVTSQLFYPCHSLECIDSGAAPRWSAINSSSSPHWSNKSEDKSISLARFWLWLCGFPIEPGILLPEATGLFPELPPWSPLILKAPALHWGVLMIALWPSQPLWPLYCFDIQILCCLSGGWPFFLRKFDGLGHWALSLIENISLVLRKILMNSLK